MIGIWTPSPGEVVTRRCAFHVWKRLNIVHFGNGAPAAAAAKGCSIVALRHEETLKSVATHRAPVRPVVDEGIPFGNHNRSLEDSPDRTK